MKHPSRKKGLCVPALVAGTLFFMLCPVRSFSASTNTASLVAQLMHEKQWADAWVECNRALLLNPDQPDLLLNKALIQLHRPDGMESALQILNTLQNDETLPQPLRNKAALQLGQQALLRNDPREAVNHFRFAFEHADSHQTFLQAGCFLGMTFNRHHELLRENPDLQAPLLTARELWTPALRQACTIQPETANTPGLLSIPGRMVVAFYRFAVSPALGARCSLEPSCSEYFRQASAKHGLLGIPIQADRFMREPSVVSAAEKPVLINGKIRFADPLSDHDFWIDPVNPVKNY